MLRYLTARDRDGQLHDGTRPVKEEQQRILKVGVQIGAGLLLFAYGLGILLSGAIFGCLFMVIGALILAFPLAHFLALPWGSLFFSESRYDRPLPMYSRAESLAKKGRYEEAMAFYEEIAEQYPDEVKPYIDMIDLAVVHLADGKRAQRIYREGMSRLADVDARATLQRMYRAIRSRMDQNPAWGHGRNIAFREQPPDAARKRWL